MGTIRPYKVVDDEYSSNASYTLDIDLPDKGRFSYMNLIVKANQDTDGYGGGPIIKTLISKVSISEGGQSHLNSAPPEAFQADFYYKTGQVWREGREKWQDADEVTSTIPIMFGESIADPYYGVDLAKMNDPQLSITYNTGGTGLDALTPFEATYYPRFTPIIYLQEGVWPALQGYQSLRQIEKYTPSNSQEKKIELKGGRPIKRVYAQYDKTEPNYNFAQCVSTGKLWGDNERYKPFEFKALRWLEIIRDVYGYCTFPYEVYYCLHDANMDCIVGHVQSIEGHVHYGGWYMDPALSSGRSFQPMYYQISDGVVQTGVATTCSFIITGLVPWDIVPIDAPNMLGMEWLDPTQNAPMYLELDHTSTAGTITGDIKVHIADKAVQY